MVKFVCVLKSGGDYTPAYVNKLSKQMDGFEFICLTDFAPSAFDFPVLALEHDLPGWWSKLEAFRIIGPVIYLDLDTFVLGSLDKLVSAVSGGECFMMLTPFARQEQWASGVMAWQGDFSFLLTNHKAIDQKEHQWDQRYISARLLEAGVKITPIQDYVDVKSYKHHGKAEKPETDILCFHGKPRPHQAQGWAKQYWNSL